MFVQDSIRALSKTKLLLILIFWFHTALTQELNHEVIEYEIERRVELINRNPTVRSPLSPSLTYSQQQNWMELSDERQEFYQSSSPPSFLDGVNGIEFREILEQVGKEEGSKPDAGVAIPVPIDNPPYQQEPPLP